MEPTLIYIIYFGILLLLGLISSIISRKLKIPNLILLIGIGMVFGYLRYDGKQIIQFSPIFLTSIAIITLSMIVFDSSSKFRFKKFDSSTTSAFKLASIFLILNTLVLSFLTNYLFDVSSVFLAVAFAAVVSGTDPSATLMILSGAKTKLFELLKVEAVLNTPLIVLIPFLLIDIMQEAAQTTAFSILSSQALPFAQQFVAGIGTGFLVAFIFFRFMKKYYSATLSPLAVITAALLTYALSEALGGNGVLAVTTAGLVFGNLYHIKHKRKLQNFTEVFSELLEIIVFILIGSMIKISWSLDFIIPASVLFLAYLFIRFITVSTLFFKDFDIKEKIYLT
ncbi:hypothetical protein GF361_01945, partial [Candidatus Woesearchaeota archaeon]|nr:hypothetical protein [Candidatus Woesearchaeota archaeon]